MKGMTMLTIQQTTHKSYSNAEFLRLPIHTMTSLWNSLSRDQRAQYRKELLCMLNTQMDGVQAEIKAAQENMATKLEEIKTRLAAEGCLKTEELETTWLNDNVPEYRSNFGYQMDQVELTYSQMTSLFNETLTALHKLGAETNNSIYSTAQLDHLSMSWDACTSEGESVLKLAIKLEYRVKAENEEALQQMVNFEMTQYPYYSLKQSLRSLEAQAERTQQTIQLIKG